MHVEVGTPDYAQTRYELVLAVGVQKELKCGLLTRRLFEISFPPTRLSKTGCRLCAGSTDTVCFTAKDAKNARSRKRLYAKGRLNQKERFNGPEGTSD
jgi:hypothetical protein